MPGLKIGNLAHGILHNFITTMVLSHNVHDWEQEQHTHTCSRYRGTDVPRSKNGNSLDRTQSSLHTEVALYLCRAQPAKEANLLAHYRNI